MSVPVAPDKKIPFEDKEEGMIYYFRPLVGDIEIVLQETLTAVATDIRPFVDKATEFIDKINAGKQWKKGEREMAIRRRAMEYGVLVQTPKDEKKDAEALKNLVNAALVGWEPTDKANPKGIPAFPKPEEGKASDFLTLGHRAKLFKIITELNDLTEAEVKN